MMMEKIARYLFVASIALAIIMGFIVGSVEYSRTPLVNVTTMNAAITLTLLILGLAVGFLNIKSKETTPFLVAAIALILGGFAESAFYALTVIHPLLYYWAGPILTYLAVLAIPVVIITAVKAIFPTEELKPEQT